MASAVAFGIVATASAQDYPSKPLRIVVPYPPGGFNDTLARTVGDRLSKQWGQSVVVDNKPGGNTVIGNQFVAKAPADGYTLLITPLPFSALPALYAGKLPYNATKDFTPIVWAGSTQNVLVVRNDLGVNNLRDLLDMAKKSPGKLNYGSTGSGSSNHLSMELFMSMSDTRMTHVAYKGSAPAVMGMLGSEIDALFDNLPNVIQQIKAGKIKAIAVTGTSRSVLLPDVPTVAEAGVPGYEVNVWFGIQAPANTPEAIIQRLNQDIVRILREPDVVTSFRNQGVEVAASTPQRFGQLVESEIVKWGAVVRNAKVTLD
jgi:tripartite-type tricarboxylate transporter receptor subunit TctC